MNADMHNHLMGSAVEQYNHKFNSYTMH